MARILALDTSSDACSVAVLDHGRVDEIFQLAPREHTRLILPMVRECLERNNLQLADMDAIAFGRGPGSFTGVRIATGIVQGLAYGVDKPVVPVSTLAAMALEAVEKYNASQVICAIDARMDELYWATYASQAEGETSLLENIDPEVVCKPESAPCSERIGNEQHKVVGVGSGWAYRDRLPESVAGLPSQVDDQLQAKAGYIAKLAAELFTAGSTVSADNALPIYLRDEVTWKKLPGR